MPPGVVLVEPEPEVLPPVVVLGELPAAPVAPPLPTAPLELPPMPLLVPVLVLPLLAGPAAERWSRRHLSRSRPVRWSQFAALGPVAPGVLLVVAELVSLELLVLPLAPVLLLGVLVLEGLLVSLLLVLPEVWAMDALVIPSSAAATAAHSVFNFI